MRKNRCLVTDTTTTTTREDMVTPGSAVRSKFPTERNATNILVANGSKLDGDDRLYFDWSFSGEGQFVYRRGIMYLLVLRNRPDGACNVWRSF